MATKIKKTWRMSEEALAIITAYAEKEGCNDTEALEQIIRHYATTAKEANQALVEDLLDKIEERYGKQITRIRLGIRTADINSQIILELLNTLMFYHKSRLSSCGTAVRPLLCPALSSTLKIR